MAEINTGAMLSAPRLKVLRAVERGGEIDSREISRAAGMTMKAVLDHVRALVKQGYFTERVEEREGRGPKYHRYVSRSALRLPVELENAIDSDWWPYADAVVVRAMHSMVSVGRSA